MTGGAIWYFVAPPTLHIYRLLGRVRVSVNAVPIVPGDNASVAAFTLAELEKYL